ncbi:MAG: pyrroline-5-carboxylate reductase [Verrucomicrobiae bacterium]|nr:pyrroline-5-carboxylate reductase [Verrucomicrobiae bacterium]
MATALARGFLGAGLVGPSGLVASDPARPALDAFVAATGGRAVSSNAEVAREADLLFLAVKPGHVPGVLNGLRGLLEPSRHLVVSIAAGVPLSILETAAPGVRIIRVMPNTPALVGASASAYAAGAAATPADTEVVQRLLASVGLAIPVAEPLLDAVTGLSGSGPAYAFLMIEALADGGVAAGLPRDIAQQLAAQTLLGAATMVLQTGQHPGVLKDAVCSPGGTTIEAVQVLEDGGLRGTLMRAVRAAAAKSRSLGNS